MMMMVMMGDEQGGDDGNAKDQEWGVGKGLLKVTRTCFKNAITLSNIFFCFFFLLLFWHRRSKFISFCDKRYILILFICFRKIPEEGKLAFILANYFYLQSGYFRFF